MFRARKGTVLCTKKGNGTGYTEDALENLSDITD